LPKAIPTSTRSTPKTEPDEFLPFKAGFANVASAAERCLCGKVPIIPGGLRYDEKKPWIGHIAPGEAIYRDNFSTKLELITFMEREVKTLSGDYVRQEIPNPISKPNGTALQHK